MTDLADKKCIPCEGGIPGFDISEIHKYLKMVDGWEVKKDEDDIYLTVRDSFIDQGVVFFGGFANVFSELLNSSQKYQEHKLLWAGKILTISLEL